MKTLRVLGTFALVMISINAVLNLRGLPAMASLGPQAMMYFALAAICFLMPSALICAELATALPENGGVYTWVRTAFGNKTGFIAIWMEWSNNLISFPASLATIVATLAYVGMPSLAANQYELFALMLVLLWGATLYNFLGIKASSRLSIIAALLGTIIPGIFIIALGAYWLLSHHPLATPITPAAVLPHWQLGSLAIFVSTLSAYSGMQITAFHAQNVRNPQRNYPKAILIAGLMILALSTLATLSICVVVPNTQINLLNGVIESFAQFFQQFHLSWLTPVLAALIALGSIGGLSAWLIGPARGMRHACQHHLSLTYFDKMNQAEMPYRILLLQAIICSGLAAIFLLMPTLKSAFWFLITLTSQFTVLMYILVFAAAIRLRYSAPELPRAFRIPGGQWVTWLVGGVGILTCGIGFLLGLFPPAAIGIQHSWHYVLSILVGDAIILAIPFMVISKKQ